jgi:fibronectin-binding autotransporter adhesin
MRKSILLSLSVFFTGMVAKAQTNVTNTGTLYLSGNTDVIFVSGSFTNASGSAFTNNGKLYVQQNFANNQASTPVGTGELILNGTAAQTIGTTTGSPFYKLTVDKASGIATLTSAVTVNNTLTLTAGKLSLDNYDLSIANSAAINGGGASNYLVAVGGGQLKQQIAAMGSKNFPVGTAAAYTPITISLAMFSTTDVFQVRMLPAVYSNGTTGSQMNSNSVNATWMVSEAVSGGSNATLTCQWPASLEMMGFNRVFSRLAQYNSSSWDYGLLNIIASGSDPYTVTRSGFTSLSAFAITMFMAVLPVRILELSGKNKGNENYIIWSTAEEQNSSYFVVETSKNAVDFTEAGRVNASGNSSSLQQYNFVHKEINGESYYYRIKLVDVKGESVYSKVILINTTAFKSVAFYPNPVKENATISFSTQQNVLITATVTNAAGLPLYSTSQRYTQGNHKMNLGLQRLPAGMYTLQMKDNFGNVQTFQFIKTN